MHNSPTESTAASAHLLASLRRALGHAPHDVGGGAERAHPRAAVALVLRAAGDDLEVLLIRRAEREGDPWSGHMAFPGGRADPRDADTIATAARETMEEVGIDVVGGGEWLGALEALHPRSGAPAISVFPHVFAVTGKQPVRPNHEVGQAYWVPLAEIARPQSAAEHEHVAPNGSRMRFPAYDVRGNVVWGLTYRMLSGFLALCAELRAQGDDR
ncbi:MAG TPA: CoA pyrophosphatase [Longimicrobiaceae bacterium]|nr:CoA pyrophosphatase [Longimicrobiaceae bacterium]